LVYINVEDRTAKTGMAVQMTGGSLRLSLFSSIIRHVLMLRLSTGVEIPNKLLEASNAIKQDYSTRKAISTIRMPWFTSSVNQRRGKVNANHDCKA
jgi:hypothetical protein